jgi:putative membrane protein
MNENMSMMNGDMSMMSMGMWLWMLLLIALVVVAIYTLIHVAINSKKNNKTQASSDTSLNTLRERFAQGELTEEEFEQKRRVLQKDK